MFDVVEEEVCVAKAICEYISLCIEIVGAFYC